MSKTVLLTGGTGFLGSYLGYEFLKRGHHVIYLARENRSRSAEERVVNLLECLDPKFRSTCSGTFEVWQGDVTEIHLGQDAAKVAAWRGRVDEVWHSAAILSFRDTYEEVSEAININGTVKVLNVAHELGVKRFHHISTAYVSGTSPGTVLESQTEHGYNFRNPYERTKYDGELQVRKLSEKYNFDTTIYRPAVIVGESGTGRSLSFTGFYNVAKIFHLIMRVLMQRVKHDPDSYANAGIVITDDRVCFPLKFPCAIDSTVNLVPIDYVVDTIMKLADTGESIGQTFHITNPNPPKIVDLLAEGCRMVNLEGVEFVDCSFDNALQLIREEIDQYAQMGLNISFCLEIREYIHYLFGEPAFDTSNVALTLKDAFTEPPRITTSFLRLLLTYAVGCQWRSMTS
jgi:nucleoside-diphosphate-sugar epimerase